MSELRPLGYFLWGALWLLLGGVVAAVPLLLLTGVLTGVLVPDETTPITVGVVATWVFGVPVCAWLFVIFPLSMLGQAAIAFVASVMATQEKYRGVQIVEFVGSGRGRSMEARVDTPALRVLTALSAVGVIPGWVFAVFAMVITAGFGVLLTVPAPMGPVFSGALVAGGAAGAIVGIRDRVNKELRKPVTDRFGLTEKYYKGLRYREGKRARDLQKARDAGQAADATPEAITAWRIAEAEHALRKNGYAAYHARKGVPGALDVAFDTTFVALRGTVTRAEAEQLVIDAAAYRGKKPVPVKAL